MASPALPLVVAAAAAEVENQAAAGCSRPVHPAASRLASIVVWVCGGAGAGRSQGPQGESVVELGASARLLLQPLELAIGRECAIDAGLAGRAAHHAARPAPCCATAADGQGQRSRFWQAHIDRWEQRGTMSDAEKKPEESKAEEEPVAGTLLACGATDWYSIGRRCAADRAVTRGGR